MIVFALDGDPDAFVWYAAPSDWVGDHVWDFDGRRLAEGWEPPAPVEVFDIEKPAADFAVINVPGLVVVNERGRDFFATEAPGAVELLPLATPAGDRWLVNVVEIAPCLDEERTDFRVDSRGIRGSVVRYVFDAEAVAQLSAEPFRVPAVRHGLVLASDRFRARYDEARLTGLRFRPVWQSG